MEITMKQYQDKIENEDYQAISDNVTVTKDANSKDIAPKVAELTKKVAESVNEGRLMEAKLEVSGLDFEISFAIQSGIINLPFQDYKKVRHFFEDDQETIVTANLVTFSDYINRSKLRIDQVAKDAADVSAANDQITQMIVANLNLAQENFAEPKKDDKKK